jgi:hypothetical protein
MVTGNKCYNNAVKNAKGAKFLLQEKAPINRDKNRGKEN